MTEPTTHPTPSTQALQNAVLAMPMARTLGLRFVRAEPGATELEMPIADAL
jgi:acyl-coenzyme A thioesterase PaaI-like protein